MRDKNRLDYFYDELKEIHKQHFPDMRYGQFMMNVFGEMSSEGIDPFFPEEDEMLTYFRRYVTKHSPYNKWKSDDFIKNNSKHNK